MANTKIPAELSSTPSISDGGNATAITIDSSENVGINTDSPFSPLHISKTDWSSGSPYGTVATIEGNNVNDNNWGHLIITDTTTSNGNGGSIRFATGSTSSLNPFAGIQGVAEGTSHGGVGIYTRPSGGTATERMRIDSSGNVAIGTQTTFSNPLTLNKAAGAAGSLNNQLSMTHTGSDRAFHLKTIRAAATDNPDGLAFVVNTTERARIETDGNFKINTVAGNGKLLVATGGGSTDDWGARLLMGSSAATSYLVDFIDHQGQRMGSIQGSTTANTVTYGETSDYRLKENVDYTWDATTRLKQLKPARFNWIRDELNTLVDGFLAHELEDIVPEAVRGEKDATETWTNAVVNSYGNYIADNVTEEQWLAGKEDGVYDENTTWSASHTQDLHQSIDQAKLVPLLTKALQEQQTLIEDLQARIETLEG